MKRSTAPMSRRTDCQSRSRLLLVTYFFPPLGGIGVQRPLRFARYLPDFGWDVTVVAPRNPSYPVRDDSLSSSRDGSYRVVRTASPELPSRPFRIRQWAQRNILYPDERAGWGLASRLSVRRLAAASDVVLSSSPPISAHVLARYAARRAGVPWVADFRDPYLGNVNFSAGGLLHGAHKKLEPRLLGDANAVTVVSEGMRDYFTDTYGVPASVVPNGYDPDDFMAEPHVRRDDSSLRITQVGSLYGLANPRTFLAGLSHALGEGGFERKLDVEFVGRVIPDYLAFIEQAGVSSVVAAKGWVPRQQALSRMMDTDLLLLMLDQGPGSEGVITGRVLEYLAARRPILACVGDGEVRRLLERTGGARIVDVRDVGAISRAITDIARNGTEGIGLPDPHVVETYSARTLARTLSATLDAAIDSFGVRQGPGQ